MKKIAIIGLVGLALITTNCKSKKTETTTNQEQKRGQQGQDPFAEMDKNNDGLLTKTEAKGPISRDFDKIDLDKDGIISREEFDKAPKPKRGEGDRPPRKE